MKLIFQMLRKTDWFSALVSIFKRWLNFRKQNNDINSAQPDFYFTNASGGILFCLWSSVNTKPALSKFQFVSSKHLQINSVQISQNRKQKHQNRNSYFLLHSRFMLLCCDIALIICSLVESSGTTVEVVAAGTVVAAAVVTGCLKAVRIWWMVTFVMWSISFFMQKPVPDGTMTSAFWKERSPSEPRFAFSRNTPDTVSIMSWGCIGKKKNVIKVDGKMGCVIALTVNSDKSTANDCGSCSVSGSSVKNDTTGSRPFFSNFIRLSRSRMRRLLRLCGRYALSLWRKIKKIGKHIMLILSVQFTDPYLWAGCCA